MKLILLAVLLAVTEADPKTYLVKTKVPYLDILGGENDHCDEDLDCQDWDDYKECVNNKCVDLVPIEVPDGGDCRKDRQCDGRSVCINKKCDKRPCEVDDDCLDVLRDDEECVNNKCVILRPFDVPDGGECRKDRQCDWRSLCKNNKCEQRPCDVDDDCLAVEECANNKCIQLPFDIPDGGECRKDRQCLYDYPCVNGKCEQPGNRTCEVASSGNIIGCYYYEECVNNICIQLKPLDVPIGGECRSVAQCLFVGEEDDKMECVNNKCQIYVKKPNGKECEEYADCVSNNCVNEVCQPDGFCLEQNHCNYEEECIEGKCKKSDKALPGQKCMKDEDCVNNECDGGRCYREPPQNWMIR